MKTERDMYSLRDIFVVWWYTLCYCLWYAWLQESCL